MVYLKEFQILVFEPYCHMEINLDAPHIIAGFPVFITML
jgi:hypothetical protein